MRGISRKYLNRKYLFQGLCTPVIFAFFVLLSFSYPEISYLESNPYGAEAGHSMDARHPDLSHQIDGHCHSGLDCSVQAVFLPEHGTRLIVDDLRLPFRPGDHTMVSRPVSFDPPPPRVLS